MVNDGGNDGVFEKYAREQDVVINNGGNIGLRNCIIQFFNWAKDKDFDFISKVDNDCLVPAFWLDDLVRILVDANADIISPNVSETNAAYKYGNLKKRVNGFIPSKFVGGIWTMKTDVIRGMSFEEIGVGGIRGAFNIINQITVDKDPRVGWTDKVTFEDVGYWAGTHPLHLKTMSHAVYSAEIGRPISWSPTMGDINEEVDQEDIMLLKREEEREERRKTEEISESFRGSL
jgi:hypothetical protein